MRNDANARSAGTVIWFSRDRGFGIIELDGGHEECFVHRDEVAGGALRARERVEFDVVERDGGLVAARVSVIRPLAWKEPYAQVEIGRPAGPRRLFRARNGRLRFGRL